MSLKFLYITNDPQLALIAEEAGVEYVWVDMEYIGKQNRQGGMNTVQNHHTVQDVANLRRVLSKSRLLVRINPVYTGTEEEIEEVLSAGADAIMLPYFKTAEEVSFFLQCIKGRAESILLFETPDSVEHIEEILALPGITACHIGLNDLHLGYGQKFLFEPLADGVVDKLCAVFRAHGLPYGFGGIARLGAGAVPAEKILPEHIRLGSSMVILSRSFCNPAEMSGYAEMRELFLSETAKLRTEEKRIAELPKEEWEKNRISLQKKIYEISGRI